MVSYILSALLSVPLSLPLEIWCIICEYLPLHTLRYFKFSNKISYNYIKKHCPKILYDKNINIVDILLQLSNMSTNFILIFYVTISRHTIMSLGCYDNDQFVVIINNSSCENKKLLFTISQLTCCLARKYYLSKCWCERNTPQHTVPKPYTSVPYIHHTNDYDYCFKIEKKVIVNINCDKSVHHLTHLQEKCVNLSIIRNELVFNCFETKQNNIKIHSCIDDIKIYTQNIQYFSNSITEYNFVLEDVDVEQIYKNASIVMDNKVMSYFIKDKIKFYIFVKVSNIVL